MFADVDVPDIVGIDKDELIVSQREAINSLNKAIEDLQLSFTKERIELIGQVCSEKAKLAFYYALIEQVKKNPLLQSEWDRFCSMLKLAADEKYIEADGNPFKIKDDEK